MDKNVFENWILGGAQNAESVEREESTEPDGSSVLKLKLNLKSDAATRAVKLFMQRIECIDAVSDESELMANVNWCNGYIYGLLASDVIDYGQADALGEVLRFKMRVQAQKIGLE